MNLKKLVLTSGLLVSTLFAGNYNVDGAHSSVGFQVKHMMISKVTGTFEKFEGTFEYDEKTDTLKSLSGKIDVTSINTANAKRDKHLNADDIFDSAKYPTIDFVVTKIDGDDVYGDFTLKGVTKNIKLDFDEGGSIVDQRGTQRAGFSLEGEINRSDFGLTYNSVLEAGGVTIGDTVKLNIEIQGKEVK